MNAIKTEKPWRPVENPSSAPGEYFHGLTSDPRDNPSNEPLWPTIAVFILAALLLVALTHPWSLL